MDWLNPDYWYDLGYLGLFIAGFIAATIFPLSSEVLFSAMLLNGYDPVWSTLCVGAGNTIGGWFSYYLGFTGRKYVLEKYFGYKAKNISRFKPWIEKYGAFLALFCWLPIVGDPLAIALGVLKTKMVLSLLFMAVGKFLRFAVLAIIIA